jgi:hypothetical protein
VHAGRCGGFDRETDAGRLNYQLMMRAPVRLLHSRAF